jgi:hypothetical protein
MTTDPSNPALDLGLGRRRWLLLSLRVGVLLLILICLWLIYPAAKIRVCLSLVARSYGATIDPKTGETVGFIRQRPSGQHFLFEGFSQMTRFGFL